MTARTFFRYFPDKDEVLFADDDELLPLMLDTIAASTGPVSAGVLMDQVLVGLAQTVEPARVSLRRGEDWKPMTPFAVERSAAPLACSSGGRGL